MRLFLAAVAMSALAACGDRQELAQGERTYRGKPDTAAWSGTGDRAAWEADLKKRQLAQDEHERIYRQ